MKPNQAPGLGVLERHLIEMLKAVNARRTAEVADLRQIIQQMEADRQVQHTRISQLEDQLQRLGQIWLVRFPMTGLPES